MENTDLGQMAGLVRRPSWKLGRLSWLLPPRPLCLPLRWFILLEPIHTRTSLLQSLLACLCSCRQTLARRGNGQVTYLILRGAPGLLALCTCLVHLIGIIKPELVSVLVPIHFRLCSVSEICSISRPVEA